MAVQFTDDATIPESTGAVTTPAGPVTTEQTPGHPESTGAVPSEGPTVMSMFGPSGQKPTGAVETPGPVTIQAVTVKVVRAPATPDPSASTAETPESRREARAAERSMGVPDDDSGR